MKIIKWLTPILTTSLMAASGSIGLISCGKSEVPSEIKEFIHDRSFSLMASAIIHKIGTPEDQLLYGAEVFGTGWIIDDSTPNDHNDYCYNIATNWHVTRGFDTLTGFAPPGYEYIGTYHFFGDLSSTRRIDKIIDITDYTWFGEENYNQEDAPISNYLFPSKGNGGIDFHVCNVNFVNASNSIKKKLDRVNAFRKEKGYINKFVDSDNLQVINKTKYVGGFPMKESSDQQAVGGKWEAHKIDSSSLSFNEPFDLYETHDIEEGTITFPYFDCSAQYVTDKNFGTDWMTGGSSGSMLLTEDLEICGIYWGGHVDDPDTPKWFKPRFSLLKISNPSYDFITRWTN